MNEQASKKLVRTILFENKQYMKLKKNIAVQDKTFALAKNNNTCQYLGIDHEVIVFYTDYSFKIYTI